MREALFKRQPLCEECERMGVATEATIRDHRIPLAEGGLDDETNEQASAHRFAHKCSGPMFRQKWLPVETW